MKYKSSEIAHVWASGNSGSGEAPSAMSFRDDEFRSYQTAIARRLPNGDIVVPTRGYSNATAKHQSAVLDAVNHKTVHRIEFFGTPRELLNDCTRKQLELCKKAATARTRKAALLVQSSELGKTLNAYLDAIEHNSNERASEGNIEDVGQAIAELAEQSKKQKQARQKALSAARRRARDLYNRWKSGKNVELRFYEFPVALRRLDENVETSRGAIVPLDAAQSLYRVFKKCKTDSQRRRLHGYRIGYYTVHDCTPEDITIGCHKIPLSAVEELALKDGWAV